MGGVAVLAGVRFRPVADVLRPSRRALRYLQSPAPSDPPTDPPPSPGRRSPDVGGCHRRCLIGGVGDSLLLPAIVTLTEPSVKRGPIRTPAHSALGAFARRRVNDVISIRRSPKLLRTALHSQCLQGWRQRGLGRRASAPNRPRVATAGTWPGRRRGPASKAGHRFHK